MKELFDVLDFEFSFFDKITQTYRGLCEGVACKDMIMGNLIQANMELFERKIESFLRKIYRNHSWKKNKDIRAIREISILCKGNSNSNSNVNVNDRLLKNIYNENEDILERLRGKNCEMTKYSRNTQIMHPRSSSNAPKTSNDHIRLLTSNTYLNKDNSSNMLLTKHTSLADWNRKCSLNNDCRDCEGSFEYLNTKKQHTTHTKSKITDNSNSIIEEMLLTKFHTLLNQYNNQLSDEESLIRNKQISELILNNAKRKRESLYSVNKKMIRNHNPNHEHYQNSP